MSAHFQAEQNDDGDGLELIEDDAGALQRLARQASLERPLQPGEEAILLERSALGHLPSQERLMAGHLAMVIRLAAARGEQGSLSVSDLVQEGSIGLVEAIRLFVGSGEDDFTRFAEARVAAQLDSAIAAEAAAVRDDSLLIAASTDYERTVLLMRRELRRKPTAEELAEKLEWTVDRTLYVAQVVAEALRRHDEELLAFIDPAALDFDDDKGERVDFDG
jgi:DNA-directed RNA polymerase sigma subunit (sigma70/sigma32)